MADAPHAPAPSRRGFLISMAAGAAVFGFPLTTRAGMDPATPSGRSIAAAGRTFEPTLWYWIDAQGRVNVHITKCEMGQHIGTSIARILADELDADWGKVALDYVDSDAKWGMMITGGSTSVWSSWATYRQAGAAGRLALVEAAAKLWGVDPQSCATRAGAVTSGDRSIGYGELVAAGLSRRFSEDELKKIPLKPNAELRLVGRDVAALDIPNKTDGKAIYGIDAKIEGMVYAVPLLPPTRLGSSVVSIDDAGAKSVKGYLRTLKLDDPTGIVPGMVLVVGTSIMAARWASQKVKVVWKSGPTAGVGDKELMEDARKLIADENAGVILDTGDTNVAPVFARAAQTLEAEYTAASVLHFQLEPVNAAAFRNKDGVWEVHAGNQWQSLILPALQAAVGAKDGEVVMRTYQIGGGFGRRLNGDYAIPAILASKALDGKPVKVVFFREEDSLFDSLRSPSVQRLRMAFDKDKKTIAMDHAAVAGWALEALGAAPAMSKGKDGKPFDPNSIDGANHWYSVGAQRVRAISHDLANKTLRPGFLRSVGPGWTNFAVESFMDEAARHVGAEPVAFRLAHLDAAGRNAGVAPSSVGGAARQAAVLRRVVEISGYAKGAAGEKDVGFGVATTFGQNRDMPTWIGCVAKVHVDRANGFISVRKIWMAVDCGTVVDPDGARAQVEGATLWGVSMALFEGATIENGRVRERNLDSYTPLRMIDAPELHIEFVPSQEMPVGLGEPGVTPIAPAIANAVFNAVGVRLRHIPMTPDLVRKALSA